MRPLSDPFFIILGLGLFIHLGIAMAYILGIRRGCRRLEEELIRPYILWTLVFTVSAAAVAVIISGLGHCHRFMAPLLDSIDLALYSGQDRLFYTTFINIIPGMYAIVCNAVFICFIHGSRSRVLKEKTD